MAKHSFYSGPVLLTDKGGTKILSIPTKHSNQKISSSRSWDDKMDRSSAKKYFSISPVHDYILPKNDYKPYDPINNCKSAGIIPYAIHDDQVYFLFQRALYPQRRKDYGWNDFGGKRASLEETTADAAAREFSEETSCLFYLHENRMDKFGQYSYNELYQMLKNNNSLVYDEQTVGLLRNLIPLSHKYFMDKITEFVSPIHASSKETYISYFVKVSYIPSADLPIAEDIHIPYDTRYIRECQWLNISQIMDLDQKDFHKRLQITRIKQRIYNYHEKGLFT